MTPPPAEENPSRGAWWQRFGRAVGLLAAVALLLELSATWFLARSPQRYDAVRRVLAGEPNQGGLSGGLMGQPYLTLVPAPNAAPGTTPAVNADGYRGRRIPMARQAGVARIVCLGDQATFGEGLAEESQTWPAQLEALLVARRPAAVPGVEVINAGTPDATTAELLTAYHFKFKYYRPDLVIVAPGAADAAAELTDFYQPDYSHWRRPLLEPRPLPPQSRWLLRSAGLSLLIIWWFRSDYLTRQAPRWPGNHQATADWYPDSDRRGTPTPLPEQEVAVRHNLRALLRELGHDGVAALLVQLPRAVGASEPPGLGALLARNDEYLETAATDYRVPLVAPAPTAADGPVRDDTGRLSAAGAAAVAAEVAPRAAAELWPGAGEAAR